MGEVWLAVRANAEQVAVKILRPHLLEKPGAFKRFQREALVGRRVRHANVVRIQDCDMRVRNGEAICYLVMEYVEGRSLQRLLEDEGPIPDWLLREIARQVAEGLNVIHEEGIIHRDLKPENLVITDDETVKIMDLGLARVADDLRLSASGQFVGSVPYAAPEQFRPDDVPHDGRADLYSLGVVLHELATGCHPFQGDDLAAVVDGILNKAPVSPREQSPSLTPFLEAVILRLLAKDPAERFQSAEGLLLVLRSGEGSNWWRRGSTNIHPMPVRRPTVTRETEVHGREQEIQGLQDLFDEARRGSGRVVLIEGAAGLGKTRLVDQLAASLEASDESFEFLYGAYAPGGAATALQAFVQAFGNRFPGADLEAGLRRHLSETPGLVRPFTSLIRGEPPRTGDEVLTRDSIHAGFVRILRSLAISNPTILCIDDLHFAPAEGSALFAAIATAIAEVPVLLLGTMRRRLSESWQGELERLEHVRAERLLPLTAEATEQLLSDALQARSIVTDLGRHVAARAGGNPFFAFEILRGLREDQELRMDESGSWTATRRVDEIPIPETITHLIEARLSELDESDRSLLEVAACCGQEFDPIVVGSALELTPIRMLRTLGRIERSCGLVRSTGRRFAFDHHQVQETLYSRLPESLREAYHALVARSLEQSARVDLVEIRGALAADICEHLVRGGHAERARIVLDAALDQLEHTYDNDRALDLARRMLEPGRLPDGDRVDLILRIAGLLELTARFDEMREMLTDALGQSDRLGDVVRRALIRMRLGALLQSRGEPDAALELFEKAVGLAREAEETALQCSILVRLGACLADLGRLEEAEEILRETRDLASRTGDPRGEAAATGSLGQIRWERGDLAGAREMIERALSVFGDLGDRRNEAALTGMLGILLSDGGHLDDAEVCYRRHLALAREIGYLRGEENATSNLGDCLHLQGRLVEARRLFRRARALSAEMGDAAGVASALVNLGAIDRDLGREDEARALLEEALALARESGVRRFEALARHGLSLVDEQVGDLTAAREGLGEALRMEEEIGLGLSSAVTRLALGRVLQALDEPEEARRHLEAAVAETEEGGLPAVRVLSLAHLALLCVVPADRVRQTLAEIGSTIEAPDRAAVHALLHRAAGDPEDLNESRRILERLEALVPEENREAVRERVIPHRYVHEAWRESRPG